ncbi:MAG TPA: HU family DNA-binding protein [bacterium (Candidatus Stahlbacteria)]|nr:HU family DNA-binding protein [Candidatus Stahlbacteria bacterium]
MTKAELVEKIAKKAKIKKRQAAVAVDTFVDAVTAALRKGQKVSLVGFGTFSVARRKGRTGFNPRTRRPIKIPAKRVPKFRPGKQLKDAVGR